MKAYIMAGKVEAKSDHAWLTKSESETALDPKYFHTIAQMMQ